MKKIINYFIKNYILYFALLIFFIFQNQSHSQGYNRASKVEVKKVVERTVSETTLIQGRIVLQKPFSISAEFTSNTKLENLSIGDFIIKGKLIAKHNSEKLELQRNIEEIKLKGLKLKIKELEQLLKFENELKQVNIKKNKISNEKLNRAKNLFDKKTISRESLDNVEQLFLNNNEILIKNNKEIFKINSELESLKNEIEVSRVKIFELTRDIDKSYVKSPIDGQLIELIEQENKYVKEGEIIAKIQPLSYFEVEADVPSQYITPLQLTDRLSGTLRDKFKLDLSLKSVYPFEKIKSGSRTTVFKLINKINNINFAQNMPVQIDIPTTLPKKVLLIPKDALIPLSNGYIVYIAEEGKAKRRIVKLGGNYDNFVIVLKGLEKDEVVITKGNEIINDGSKISVMNSSKSKKKFKYNKKKKQ